MALLTDIGKKVQQFFSNFTKPTPTNLYYHPQQRQQIQVANYTPQQRQQTINSIPIQVRQPVQNAIGAIGNVNLGTALSAIPGASNAQFLKPYFPTIGEYAQNQIINPLKTAGNKNENILSRGLSGAMAGFNMTPFSLPFNVGTGVAAGTLKSIRERTPLQANIRSSIQNPSDIGGTGLGIQNPFLAMGVDVATMNPKGGIKALRGAFKNAKGIMQGIKGVHPDAFRLRGIDLKEIEPILEVVKKPSLYTKEQVIVARKGLQNFLQRYTPGYVNSTDKKAIKLVEALLDRHYRVPNPTKFPKMDLVGKGETPAQQGGGLYDTIKVYSDDVKKIDFAKSKMIERGDKILSVKKTIDSRGEPVTNIKYKPAGNVAQQPLYDIKPSSHGFNVFDKSGDRMGQYIEGKRGLGAFRFYDNAGQEHVLASVEGNLIKKDLNSIFGRYNTTPQQPVKTTGKIATREVKTQPPAGFSAEATPQTINRVATRNEKAIAQQANKDFIEWQKNVYKQEGSRTTLGAVNKISKTIGGKTKSSAVTDIEQLKDISSPATKWVDVFRNFRKVYGKKYEEVKKVVLDPLFVKGKTDLLNDQESWIKRISSEVEGKNGFNIKKGSRESADVQKYGEGLISKEDIIKKYGEKRANDIVRADKWFREQYDALLNEVNAVRAKIYPNNPDKIIPRRKDYYRHFSELSQGIDGLLNTLGKAIDVSPELAGISYQTRPKSKWLSFAQRRLGAKTEYDAVGGFIDYVKAQTYAKNIDPHIDTFRQLARELSEAGVEKNKGLNNFTLFLNQFADDLAGKTNPADRFIQETIGRKPMAVVNWINNRTKANVILGNASSALAQAFNLQNGIAEAGPKYAIRGFGKTIVNMFKKEKPMNNSVFLRERYFRGFGKFDRGMINNTRKFSAWMITALDEASTKSMWNMMYEKAISKGIPNPVNYADEATRRMVAGRGIGEMPLIQKSKLFQVVAPFQVEVANAWHVIGDFVGEKAFGKLMTLALTSYVMNRAAEKIRGSDVSFDPLNAIKEGVDAFNEEENKGKGALRFGGRIAGEFLSNIPLGQSIAGAYPEYGFKVGDTQFPTREGLFGEGDPTRYGSGLLASKGLQDPLFKLIPSFGGQQLKRIYEGGITSSKGYSETPGGRVRFPTEQNFLNDIQRMLFGQYSTPNAQKYFDSGASALGEKQSETFKKLSPTQREAYYESVMKRREAEKGGGKTANSGKGFFDMLFGKASASNEGEMLPGGQGSIEIDTRGLTQDEIDDVARERLKAEGGWFKSEGKIMYKDGDSIKTIKITPETKGTGIGAFANTDFNQTKAADVWNSNLPEDAKLEVLKGLGVDPEDARYAGLTKYNSDVSTQYIISKSPDHDTLIKNIITGRVVGITGSQFADNGVISKLVEQGYLTSEEGAYLKKIKLDKNGNQIGKLTGKKAKKISIAKAPAIKSVNFGKATTANIPKFSFAPPPKIDISFSSSIPTRFAKFQAPKFTNTLTSGIRKL